MPKHDAQSNNNDYPPEKWPTLLERIREIALNPDMELGPDEQVTYSWHHGGESFRIEPTDKHGGLNYSGTFHPRAGLCMGNPCDYCGAVSHD